MQILRQSIDISRDEQLEAIKFIQEALSQDPHLTEIAEIMNYIINFMVPSNSDDILADWSWILCNFYAANDFPINGIDTIYFMLKNLKLYSEETQGNILWFFSNVAGTSEEHRRILLTQFAPIKDLADFTLLPVSLTEEQKEGFSRLVYNLFSDTINRYTNIFKADEQSIKVLIDSLSRYFVENKDEKVSSEILQALAEVLEIFVFLGNLSFVPKMISNDFFEKIVKILESKKKKKNLLLLNYLAY